MMLSVTGVDKGDVVPTITCIVYGPRALAQKLASNIKLTRSHNVKNVLQHTELDTSLTKSRLLLAKSEIISLCKTIIPSGAISHRKTAPGSVNTPSPQGTIESLVEMVCIKYIIYH